MPRKTQHRHNVKSSHEKRQWEQHHREQAVVSKGETLPDRDNGNLAVAMAPPAKQAQKKPQWRVIQSDDDMDVGNVNDDALLAEMGKSSWGTMALTAPLAVN